MGGRTQDSAEVALGDLGRNEQARGPAKGRMKYGTERIKGRNRCCVG